MAAVLSQQLVVQSEALLAEAPSIFLQAVIIPGEETTEGQIIEAVAAPWFEIIALLLRDPNAPYEFSWRKWEEIVAASYKARGYDVVLTPRSGDGGRDVIASSRGFGSIRYFDQVKAYAPGRVVTANDVRAMIGVLTVAGNVSKGIITTTSEFAPGICADEGIKALMPYRLELRARAALLEWLRTAAGIGAAEGSLPVKPDDVRCG